ncbi:Pteridine-dependent deoxygenase [Wenzhouxiangella marina]|uniref:Pteridine-dependent deoxygenase n=1 Tax=Wenzhouxiangella marina TaxID=1579979 RepID=A0A0K0Y0E4_9GAMM|nr:Pteridine-dependent deoxygenase [Wenzhouxiangella marina]
MASPESSVLRNLPRSCGLSARPGTKDPQALLRFGFRAAAEHGLWPLGLDWIGGDLDGEVWCGRGPIEQGRQGAIDWNRAGGCLSLSLVLDDPPEQDPEARVHAAYRDLIELARSKDCPHLLRAWNYLPAINEGAGDAERYRRFCLGRARALEAAGYDEASLCAGTAIGGEEPKLRLHLLCGSEPGVNIENPRQVSAYRYPRQYGPRSPSFARATLLPGAEGEALLMISGTASVVGHETRHVGDVLAQTREILANMDSLLAESARRSDRPGLARFGADSLVRVYLREAADWPAVERLLRDAWPGARLAAFRGDVCRSDLLVEIEAVTHG